VSKEEESTLQQWALVRAAPVLFFCTRSQNIYCKNRNHHIPRVFVEDQGGCLGKHNTCASVKCAYVEGRILCGYSNGLYLISICVCVCCAVLTRSLVLSSSCCMVAQLFKENLEVNSKS